MLNDIFLFHCRRSPMLELYSLAMSRFTAACPLSNATLYEKAQRKGQLLLNGLVVSRWLAIRFWRPIMDRVAHPAGAQPWNSPWCPSSSPTLPTSSSEEAHFIKTVEDLHEALVGAVPGIRFGLAFCEASGKRLVRWSGNDEAALALARDNALAIGPGHTFLIFLGDGFFPVNVLAAVRAVPEVCRIIARRPTRHR